MSDCTGQKQPESEVSLQTSGFLTEKRRQSGEVPPHSLCLGDRRVTWLVLIAGKSGCWLCVLIITELSQTEQLQGRRRRRGQDWRGGGEKSGSSGGIQKMLFSDGRVCSEKSSSQLQINFNASMLSCVKGAQRSVLHPWGEKSPPAHIHTHTHIIRTHTHTSSLSMQCWVVWL